MKITNERNKMTDNTWSLNVNGTELDLSANEVTINRSDIDHKSLNVNHG